MSATFTCTTLVQYILELLLVRRYTGIISVPPRKQPRLLICSRRNECGKLDKNGNAKSGGAAYGIPTFRPASWPLGCLQGKAEEITVSSPWDGGMVGGCRKEKVVRIMYKYFDVCRGSM